MADDEDEDKDASSESDKIMPISIESYKIKQEVGELATKIERMDTNVEEEGLSDFMQRQPSSMFLMQLSDALPGLPPEPKIINVDSKVGVLEAADTSAASSGSGAETDNFCTVRHLPEGQIGELIRYRSGRMVLVLGDNNRFEVTHGVDSTFLQVRSWVPLLLY